MDKLGSPTDMVAYLEAENEQLQADNKRLRKIIAKYACHKKDCPFGEYGVDHVAGRYGGCSCGLTEALTKGKGK